MRPDIIVRVFYLKVKSLLHEVKKNNIFEKYEGCVWTIEYQKRGLLHMHLLLFLHPDDQFLTVERINEVICAELPSLDTQPELYDVVTTTMLHDTPSNNRKCENYVLKHNSTTNNRLFSGVVPFEAQ